MLLKGIRIRDYRKNCDCECDFLFDGNDSDNWKDFICVVCGEPWVETITTIDELEIELHEKGE